MRQTRSGRLNWPASPYRAGGGLVIGNDRNLVMLLTPTISQHPVSPVTLRHRIAMISSADRQLNESGGSVGIDNEAVKRHTPRPRRARS
jgi:hypothetical protein